VHSSENLKIHFQQKVIALYHFIGPVVRLAFGVCLWLPRILFSGTSWDFASVVGSEVWKEPTDGSVCVCVSSSSPLRSHSVTITGVHGALLW